MTQTSSRGGKSPLIGYIGWIPAVIVFVIIIFLTLQTGNESLHTSSGIAIKLSKTSMFGTYGYISESAAKLESFNALIRTLAHISEYMALSFFIGLAVTLNGFRKEMRFFYMCFLGMAVACFDEFLQIFVPGRYCDIKDLVCDFLGIVFVAGVLFCLGRLFKRAKSSGQDRKSVRRTFLNIEIDNITFDQAVSTICQMAELKERKYIITPNSDHVIKMQKDLEFRQILTDADLILTDGTPLMWIADSLGHPIKDKIPGADILPAVCKEAAKTCKSIFIFGAGEGVASQAAKNLKKKNKGLKIAGTYTPSMDFGQDKEEVDKAIKAINARKPDILVLSLGSPKQEKFLYKYKDQMEFGVALPVGAAVDFEAGNVNRAPKWMRSIGLEWFYRFLQEPGRLFKRYFIDDMKIFYLAWKYRNEVVKYRDEDSI